VREIWTEENEIPFRKRLHAVPDKAATAALDDLCQFDLRVKVPRSVEPREAPFLDMKRPGGSNRNFFEKRTHLQLWLTGRLSQEPLKVNQSSKLGNRS
jgi:hypothetical protein